jgi:hypothetical protein
VAFNGELQWRWIEQDFQEMESMAKVEIIFSNQKD